MKQTLLILLIFPVVVNGDPGPQIRLRIDRPNYTFATFKIERLSSGNEFAQARLIFTEPLTPQFPSLMKGMEGELVTITWAPQLDDTMFEDEIEMGVLGFVAQLYPSSIDIFHFIVRASSCEEALLQMFGPGDVVEPEDEAMP